MHKNRFLHVPSVLFCLMLLFLAVLTGCGDEEPSQRKAFIRFLQERVIEPSGILLPSPSRDEKKSFGPYLEHYEIMQVFQNTMTKDTTKNARHLLDLAELETLDAINKAKKSLRAATKEAEKLQGSVAILREKTDKARAKLKQPDDLKAVYDKAYEKVVLKPSETATVAFKAIEDMFAATLELLDFIDTHNHDMEIAGQSINLRNPGLMDDLSARMEAVQQKSMFLRQAYLAMMKALLQ